ncbi:MAG: hypothetical protein AAFU03_08605, partial [Bacteroidota bacterium]
MANQKPNRYPGVQPFRTDQASIFFGRQADTQRLFSTVSSERLTVLYGKSGYGKSSLIQAGLLPRLAEENLRGRRQYIPLVVRFNAYQGGASLFDKYAFHKLETIKKQGIEWVDLDLSGVPQSLWGNWKRLAIPEKAVIVLLFDQFEEFFSYPRTQQEAFKE